jgi:enoyl-CoA hydratase/carnithine racemase
MNMTAAYPRAAAALRAQKLVIAARALEAAVAADPGIATRHGEVALRQLLRDTEALIERLAMSMGSGDPRWLAEYAEWVGPIYRRRGVPQADVATLCEGLREAAGPAIEPDAAAQMNRTLDAAIAVFQKNGRLAGDQHKRNALLRWLYRGV